MPRKADTHIQKIAPGPPIHKAAATPTIFPVPIAAASAAEKVWNCVSVCFPTEDLCFRRPPNVRDKIRCHPQS